MGSWWFCNNPSLIAATTAMRLEMLGTAFTCQHSDARVLEQLLYKCARVALSGATSQTAPFSLFSLVSPFSPELARVVAWPHRTLT